MQQAVSARSPAHFWIVGFISLLWNAFGAFDYFMTRTKGAEWINQMMSGVNGEQFMTYVNAFPLWASFGWGLGVWLALAGSILLLMRSRFAVPAFGISLFGAVIGIGYQIINPVDIAEMHAGFNAFVPYMVILIAVALFLYARAMVQRGVLR